MVKLPAKVLIVEDSRAINVVLVNAISTSLHFDVEVATTLEEAKELLDAQSDEFFVAILDLNLPDAPNGEIVDLVLERNVPPIILTGSISENLHREMIEKPIIDYVVKRNLNEIEYVVDTVRRLKKNMGQKALVVDDSKASLHLLAALLRRQYLEVFEASNGVEALKVLEQHDDIVLVVTDYNMPIMDGAELTSTIRQEYSRNDLAIIGISSMESASISIKLLKSGANDFLSRPFLHEEFYCRVNQNIDSITNYRMLRDAADCDFLTGLHNRKYFFNTGEKLFQNAKRSNISIMLAMFDIDHFKCINDTHGHHVGDMALQHIASLLSKNLRRTDCLARIGGEEFCLMCVNVDDEHSDNILERYRSAIMDSPLILDELTVPITVSIGYTLHIVDSLELTLKDADSALYEAKQTGRNKVVEFKRI